MTAIVQSSSATTLTTIGFVSAGLLTLPQAIGVVMGANLGITSTAWLVSTARLEAQRRNGGVAASSASAPWRGCSPATDWRPPVRRSRASAWCSTRMDPASVPGASTAGKLLLIVLGMMMTVVLQSSSAAIATTLAGVETGTISLVQAAALIIGQNVGTTITAGIAAVGAAVPARRTALAHVLFNAITGAVALFFLPLFIALVSRTSAAFSSGNPTVTVALFHTVFNVAGVALLLPLTGPFAALVTRIVSERGSIHTRHLDPSVTHVPAVAVEAARRSLKRGSRRAHGRPGRGETESAAQGRARRRRRRARGSAKLSGTATHRNGERPGARMSRRLPARH